MIHIIGNISNTIWSEQLGKFANFHKNLVQENKCKGAESTFDDPYTDKYERDVHDIYIIRLLMKILEYLIEWSMVYEQFWPEFRRNTVCRKNTFTLF